MNKNFLALGLAAALLAPQVAGAEGFAINEWSAEGVAMGGARMFAEDDAANVAYNPASITKVKGEVMKSSYTYLSPHGNYKLYDGAGKEIEDGKNVVHAGWAVGSYYVRQINDKEWFGIGAFPRFAMVSEFERASKASTNAFFSKLNGVSVTPTYAHKFDKNGAQQLVRKSTMSVWSCRRILIILLIKWCLVQHKQKVKAMLWAGMLLPTMHLMIKTKSV